MAFGKREAYTDDLIEYAESVDMLLSDLRTCGLDITKEELNRVLQHDTFSISRMVRKELSNVLGFVCWVKKEHKIAK